VAIGSSLRAGDADALCLEGEARVLETASVQQKHRTWKANPPVGRIDLADNWCLRVRSDYEEKRTKTAQRLERRGFMRIGPLERSCALSARARTSITVQSKHNSLARLDAGNARGAESG
jgi:hypothetical protein